MKATLKFDLPSEQVDFHQAINANNAFSAIRDFGAWLRQNIKYKEDQYIDYQTVSDKFYEIINDNNIGGDYDAL